MIKLVAFLALLLALAFGFSLLADTPGHVLLAYAGVEYRVSLITAAVGLAVLTFAAMAFWSVLRLVFRLPSLIGFANRMRRQARGQQAVARGLIAVGTGDQRLAQRSADEARRLLGNEPLAMLLRAQASQLSGDRKGAEEAFKAMLDRPDTTTLGLRGLFLEAERHGDTAAARLFAEEALRRAPDTPWAGQAMLGVRASARDWRGATAIIDQHVSRRLIDRAEGKTQRAILLAAAAREASDQAPEEALALALEALRNAPTLVPAAEIAARRLSAKGDLGKATRILETAWKQSPHPDLAEAYLAVRHGDSALDRLKRARHLAKLAPDARESRFAVARAAIDAREFSTAREALESLALQKPTARACLLMAELEELESGNQGLVRAWLARASRAPRDPAWVADGVVSDEWAPVSPVTGRIGAFEWRDPPQAAETHLRARIDADRFEKPPEIAVLVPAAPEIQPAVTAVSIAAAEAPAPAGKSSDSPSPTTSTLADFQPIIPDDPGPDPDAPKPKGAFRFFG